MAKYNMTLIALCIVAAVIGTAKGEFNKEEAIKHFMEKAEACRTETNAQTSDIDGLLKKEPAASPEGKCLRACIMKKYEVMTADGKFNKEVGLGHIREMTNDDPEKMKIATAIADICEAQSLPSDHCEAAEALGKCFKEQAKAKGVEKMDF